VSAGGDPGASGGRGPEPVLIDPSRPAGFLL